MYNGDNDNARGGKDDNKLVTFLCSARKNIEVANRLSLLANLSLYCGKRARAHSHKHPIRIVHTSIRVSSNYLLLPFRMAFVSMGSMATI